MNRIRTAAPPAGRARAPRGAAACSCSTRRWTRWRRASPPTPPCASTATPSSRRGSSPCTAPGRASAACASRAPRSAANRRYRWSATVTGFGALRTLRPESGLHVLEVPDGRGGYDRRRVRVTRRRREARTRRRRATTIVRRYRERPTPLVRDAVRGWRTGRLDAVLAGGFDLIE